MLTEILPGLGSVGLITVFCTTFQVSHTRTVPSSLDVKPVYLHSSMTHLRGMRLQERVCQLSYVTEASGHRAAKNI